MMKHETMKDWIKRPLFIVGYPKSGTILMINLLDNHSELMVLSQESEVYTKLFRLLKGKQFNNKEEKLEAIIKHLSEDTNLRVLGLGKAKDSIRGNFDYSDFDFSTFLSKLKNKLLHTELTPKEIITAIVQSYSETSTLFREKVNFKYWVEKTPRHFLHVDEIKNDFPTAKLIHIIRDPRDNWVSYKKKKGDKLDLSTFCYRWQESVSLAQKNLEKYGSETFMYVKYEELVSKNKEVMKQIIDFLNIKEEESLFNPSKHGKSWYGNSMWNERNTKQAISKSAIGRYKTLGKTSDIQYIESVLNKAFDELGYKKTHKNNIGAKLHFSFFSFKKRVRKILRGY